MILLQFVLGACIASFVGVCAMRRGTYESIVTPNSRCDHCKTPLQPLDMIPILSYLHLRGKCKYCGAQIPWILFAAEIFGGVAFVLLFQTYPLSLSSILMATLLFILLYMSIVDGQSLEVDNVPLYAVVFIVLLLRFINLPMSWFSLLGIGVWALFSYILRDSMGDGDKILIGILLLLFTPWQQLWFFFYCIWAAAIPALILLLRGHNRKTKLPFVPFIMIGLLAAFVR